MIIPEKLKQMLMQIKNNNYKVPDTIDAFELALDMTEHIGNTNSELREKLIYGTYYYWIFNRVFTAEQLRQLLNICIDENHLFYKIGEKDTDSVFTRTFSVLIIPLVLYVDQKSAFLTKQEIYNIKEKVLEYLEQEKDLRGYVEGKGWADARAHAADAIDDIAKSVHIGQTDLQDMLAAIKKKISIGDYPCVSNEDERMSTAVMSILERKILTDDEIIFWIESFAPVEKIGIYPFDLYFKTNTKHFLRSLYFKLLKEKYSQLIMESIVDTLERI